MGRAKSVLSLALLFCLVLSFGFAANATFIATVRDYTSHVAISGASVYVHNANWSSTKYTDANGTATFTGVPLANYSVSLSAAGYYSANSSALVKAPTTSMTYYLQKIPATTTTTIPPSTATFTATVLEAGCSGYCQLAGATVRVTNASGTRTFTTNSSGMIRTTLAVGNYTVVSSATGHYNRTVSQAVTAPATSVTYYLDLVTTTIPTTTTIPPTTATFTATVLEAGCSGYCQLAGATVRVTNASGTRTFTTNSSGMIRTTLAVGNYTVVSSATGHYNRTVSQAVTAPATSVTYYLDLVTTTIPTTTTVNAYHNHLHSFSVNYNDPSRIDTYAYENRLAYEMGYSMVSAGKPGDAKYNQTGILKNHNAQVFPLDLVDLDTASTPSGKFMYRDPYHGAFDPAKGEYRSAFDTTKYIYEKYDISAPAIEFIKNYACAKPGADLNRLSVGTFSSALLDELFYSSWRVTNENGIVSQMTLFSNWQSRKVVEDLTQKTIDTLGFEPVDGLFIDQISGWPSSDSCGNAARPDGRAYPSWRDGQKAFLLGVVTQLRNRTGASGKPYFITANIDHPKLWYVQRFAGWYADNSLRFDHYYAERGNARDPVTGSIVTSLEADGTDPETGRPAFMNGNGYIPADRVSVDTEYGWYGIPGVLDYALAGFSYREDDYWNSTTCTPPSYQDDYFTQHLRAAGTAGNQGSWFGWYGEDIPHDKDEYVCENGTPRRKTESEKSLVYTNDMQLLRAIPNWDNLAGVPIRVSGSPQPGDPRYWDKAGLIYRSSNSYASRDVIYSRQFRTGEIFAVFRTLSGEVQLRPGESVKSAYFANKYFERTIDDDAARCLVVQQGTIRLNPVCSDKMGIGIRMSNQTAPYQDGLVSYWNFDEGSGSVLHDSVSANNGYLSGASWTAGKNGSALAFSGGNGSALFGDVLDMETSDVSVSFWIKTASNATSSVIAKAYDVPYYYVMLWQGRLAALMHDGQAMRTVTSRSVINDNRWHQIAAVWKRDGNMSLYIDGAKDSFSDISADKGVRIANDDVFTIGANCKYAGLCANGFSGALDDVRFYNRALSEQATTTTTATTTTIPTTTTTLPPTTIPTTTTLLTTTTTVPPIIITTTTIAPTGTVVLTVLDVADKTAPTGAFTFLLGLPAGNGRGLRRALVRMEGPKTKFSKSDFTADDGTITFSAPAGTYVLSVSLDGYSSASASVTVLPNTVVHKTVYLKRKGLLADIYYAFFRPQA